MGLRFRPSRRATATELLNSLYFQEVHDEECEPICEKAIDWGFDSMELTPETVCGAIYKECASDDMVRRRRRSSTGMTERMSETSSAFPQQLSDTSGNDAA